MAIKKFSQFLQEARPKGAAKYNLDDIKSELEAAKGDTEKLGEIITKYKVFSKKEVWDILREYDSKYKVGILSGRGRKKASETDDDDDKGEGTQEVFGFVVLTDNASERFFLNKTKTKFVKYNKADVFTVKLGTANKLEKINKGELNKLKQKVLGQIPDQIGKYDKYEDDIEVLTTFELAGAPAALYGSDGSMDDEF